MLKFRIEDLLITPEMASSMIAKSAASGRKNYRKFDNLHARKLAQDMVEGRWRNNGDPVRVAVDGLIEDGQHRMSAIVQSGIPIRMIVYFDFDAEAIDVRLLDTGKGRNLGTHLAAAGLPNSSLIASTVKLALVYQRGEWATTENLPRHALRDSECHEYVEAWKETLIDCAALANRCRRVATVSLVGALLFVGCRGAKPSEREQAVEFVEKLANGSDLKLDDPVYSLRRRLMDSRSSKFKRLTPYADRNLMTTGWNKHVSGKPCRIIQLTDRCPEEILPVRF